MNYTNMSFGKDTIFEGRFISIYRYESETTEARGGGMFKKWGSIDPHVFYKIPF
jgi:hypothetical protein